MAAWWPCWIFCARYSSRPTIDADMKPSAMNLVGPVGVHSWNSWPWFIQDGCQGGHFEIGFWNCVIDVQNWNSEAIHGHIVWKNELFCELLLEKWWKRKKRKKKKKRFSPQGLNPRRLHSSQGSYRLAICQFKSDVKCTVSQWRYFFGKA